MKIGIIGTQCIGKSTYTNDFIKQWPMYTKPSTTYRDIIKEKSLNINKEGDEASQEIILNALIDEVMQNKDGDHVIFDRCVIDNLIYSMWLNAMGKVSDEFVKKSIGLVRETLVFFDIIFFLPITAHSPVNITEGEQRDIDPMYRNEIDLLFKTLMSAYTQESRVYFPFNHKLGCPAIIEIFGTPEERIALSKFYLTDKGNIYGEEESLLIAKDKPMDDDGLALAREIYQA